MDGSAVLLDQPGVVEVVVADDISDRPRIGGGNSAHFPWVGPGAGVHAGATRQRDSLAPRVGNFVSVNLIPGAVALQANPVATDPGNEVVLDPAVLRIFQPDSLASHARRMKVGLTLLGPSRAGV